MKAAALSLRGVSPNGGAANKPHQMILPTEHTEYTELGGSVSVYSVCAVGQRSESAGLGDSTLSRRSAAEVERLDLKPLDVRANVQKRVGVNALHLSVFSLSKRKRTSNESSRLNNIELIEKRARS